MIEEHDANRYQLTKHVASCTSPLRKSPLTQHAIREPVPFEGSCLQIVNLMILMSEMH
jgi:hypothetical protein